MFTMKMHFKYISYPFNKQVVKHLQHIMTFKKF